MDLGRFLLSGQYVTLEQLNGARRVKDSTPGQTVGGILAGSILNSPKGQLFLDNLIEYLDANPDYMSESSGFIDYSLANQLDSDYMRQNRIFPLGKLSHEGRTKLKVMSEDKDNLTFLDFIAKRFDAIPPALATAFYSDTMLERLIQQADRFKNMAMDIEVARQELDGTAALLKEVNDDRIVKLTNKIIGDGMLAGASDVHFEIGERAARARYRIDGDLEKTVSIDIKEYLAVVSRIKIIAKLDIAERRMPQDGKISLNTKLGRYNIRVSTLPTEYGESVVLRLLNLNNLNEMRLNKLGMPDSMLRTYNGMISKPYGLILVTGPTGSGKTTTLYASLQEKQQKNFNIKICTVEDPIEYNLSGINQTQINEKIDLNFPRVLRALLRQDPDVIMVGEIRDEETAQLAIRSAQTGHLVLSTLHTNNSAEAIGRLSNMGVPRYLVASSLLGIMAQRLVKKLCDGCKDMDESVDPEPFEKAGLTPVAYKSLGCDRCNGTGYKGRIGLYELFPIKPAHTEDIETNEKIDRLYTARSVVSMYKYGLIKVNEGQTSLSEVLEKTMEI